LPKITLINGKKSFTAREAGDLDSGQAVEKAKELHAQKKYFKEAHVDRFGGLVLVGREGNWHFVWAACGFNGAGTIATAEILEMFGFGEKKAILQNITVGGDQAYYPFTHPL